MNKNMPQNIADNGVESAWDEFVAFLKQREARITKARKYVLEHALSRKDHFRADEVAMALAKGAKRVSRGTVYRTLALMVEAGFLRQIRDSDTHVHYEANWGNPHHEHMICDHCGKFIEFDDDVIFRHLEAACRENNFTQRCHRIVIFGICAKCSGKGDNGK